MSALPTQIPPGFTLDEPDEKKNDVPPGFVLDEPNPSGGVPVGFVLDADPAPVQQQQVAPPVIDPAVQAQQMRDSVAHQNVLNAEKASAGIKTTPKVMVTPTAQASASLPGGNLDDMRAAGKMLADIRGVVEPLPAYVPFDRTAHLGTQTPEQQQQIATMQTVGDLQRGTPSAALPLTDTSLNNQRIEQEEIDKGLARAVPLAGETFAKIGERIGRAGNDLFTGTWGDDAKEMAARQEDAARAFADGLDPNAPPYVPRQNVQTGQEAANKFFAGGRKVLDSAIAPPQTSIGQGVQEFAQSTVEAAPLMAAAAPLAIPAKAGQFVAAGADPLVGRVLGGLTSGALGASEFGTASAATKVAAGDAPLSSIPEAAIAPFTATGSLASKIANGDIDKTTPDEWINLGFLIAGGLKGKGDFNEAQRKARNLADMLVNKADAQKVGQVREHLRQRAEAGDPTAKYSINAIDEAIAKKGKPDVSNTAQDLGNASAFQRTLNGPSATPQDSGDVANLGSLLSEFDRTGDIKFSSAVLKRVLPMVEDSQVAKSIVPLIPVDVVNDLTGKQFTPEMLLHNPSVLQDLLRTSPDGRVVAGLLRSIVDALASRRAGDGGASRRAEAKGDAANQASLGNLTPAVVGTHASFGAAGSPLTGFVEKNNTTPSTLVSNGHEATLPKTEQKNKQEITQQGNPLNPRSAVQAENATGDGAAKINPAPGVTPEPDALSTRVNQSVETSGATASRAEPNAGSGVVLSDEQLFRKKATTPHEDLATAIGKVIDERLAKAGVTPASSEVPPTNATVPNTTRAAQAGEESSPATAANQSSVESVARPSVTPQQVDELPHAAAQPVPQFDPTSSAGLQTEPNPPRVLPAQPGATSAPTFQPSDRQLLGDVTPEAGDRAELPTLPSANIRAQAEPTSQKTPLPKVPQSASVQPSQNLTTPRESSKQQTEIASPKSERIALKNELRKQRVKFDENATTEELRQTLEADRDANLSDDDRSHIEWRENAAKVAENPQAASEKDLIRAGAYLDAKRTSYIRRQQEAGKSIDPEVVQGIDSEISWYKRLANEKAAKPTTAARIPETPHVPEGRTGEAAAPTKEELQRVDLVRKWGDKWQYRMRAGGPWYHANSEAGAIDSATKTYVKAKPEERMTPQERGAAADRQRFAEMDARYGKLSISQVQKILDDARGVKGVSPDREFTGTGGRRTGAAVANEGARDAGETALQLGIYLRERMAREQGAAHAEGTGTGEAAREVSPRPLDPVTGEGREATEATEATDAGRESQEVARHRKIEANQLDQLHARKRLLQEKLGVATRPAIIKAIERDIARIDAELQTSKAESPLDKAVRLREAADDAIRKAKEYKGSDVGLESKLLSDAERLQREAVVAKNAIGSDKNDARGTAGSGVGAISERGATSPAQDVSRDGPQNLQGNTESLPRVGAGTDSGASAGGRGVSTGGTALGQSTAPQPPALKPWEMSQQELDDAFQQARHADKRTDERVFGTEAAKKYKGLQRIANSMTETRARQDAAVAAIQKMEDALTPAQRDELFGNTPGFVDPSELRDYRNAIGSLDGDSPEALGASLKKAITDVGEKTDPEQMNHRERVAYAQLRRASEITQEQGWNPDDVSKAAIKAAVSRFGDKNDAAFMLSRFLKKPGAPTAVQTALPEAQKRISSDATTAQERTEAPKPGSESTPPAAPQTPSSEQIAPKPDAKGRIFKFGDHPTHGPAFSVFENGQRTVLNQIIPQNVLEAVADRSTDVMPNGYTQRENAIVRLMDMTPEQRTAAIRKVDAARRNTSSVALWSDPDGNVVSGANRYSNASTKKYWEPLNEAARVAKQKIDNPGVPGRVDTPKEARGKDIYVFARGDGGQMRAIAGPYYTQHEAEQGATEARNRLAKSHDTSRMAGVSYGTAKPGETIKTLYPDLKAPEGSSPFKAPDKSSPAQSAQGDVSSPATQNELSHASSSKPVEGMELQGEKGAGEVEPLSNTAPRVAKSDISRELATRAHSGTSFVPERRAEQRQQEYVDHMNAVWQDVAPLAKTPEQRAILAEQFERYRQGFIAKTNAVLSAASRTMSAMITGPARFPVDSNRKRFDTQMRRYEEMKEWSDRAQRAMRKAIAPEASGIISSDQADAPSLLQKKIDAAKKLQAAMVATNKIVRDKKLTPAEKVEQIKALGISEETASKALQPDFIGRVGFPDYRLSNNNANIKRMESRVAQIERTRAVPSSETAFEGGKVIDNADANRVQIKYDAKPDRATIEKLKKNGFRWTPSEGVWQRQRNLNGITAAEYVTGVKVSEAKPAAVAAEPETIAVPESITADEDISPSSPTASEIETPTEQRVVKSEQSSQPTEAPPSGSTAAASGRGGEIVDPFAGEKFRLVNRESGSGDQTPPRAKPAEVPAEETEGTPNLSRYKELNAILRDDIAKKTTNLKSIAKKAGIDPTHKTGEQLIEAIIQAEERPENPSPNRLPGGRRAGGTTLITPIAKELIGLTGRMYRMAIDAPSEMYRAAKVGIPKGVNAMRMMGETGKKFAAQTEQVARRGAERGETDTRDMEQVLSGLNAEQAEIVAKIGQLRADPKTGKPYRELYPKLAKIADEARDIADRGMHLAEELGITRAGTGELKGSGGWYPQTPNKDGRDLLNEAAKRGLGSPRVMAVAEKLVREGKAKTPEDALVRLRQYRESQLRGENKYFESTRVLLPEEYVDFNPRHTLPALLHKNGLFNEAVRMWGTELERAKAMIEKIGQESTPQNADILSDWLKAHFFAKHAGLLDKSLATAGNAITSTKLGYSAMSALQNMGQRFSNTVMYEPQVTLKAMAKYPPFINRWMESAREIEDRIARAGITSPTSELSDVESTAWGHGLTKASMKPFSSVEGGNQTTASLIAEIGIQRDMDRLAEMPEGSKLRKVLESIVSLTGLRDPDAAAERRVERVTNLSSEQLMQRVKSGKPLSADELHDAMWRFNNDTQFALNFATERLWWRNHPFFKLMAKFKPWGIDQLGFIGKHVVKEAGKGNFGPAVRFGVAMVLVGELYNTVKDMLTGSDKSVTSYMTSGRDKEAGEIASRVLNDFTKGGGIGVIADMSYGVMNWLGGPAVSTAGDVMTLGKDINQNKLSPMQWSMALRKFGENDISAYRQVDAAINRADRIFNANNRAPVAARWRQRAGAYRSDKENPTAIDKASNWVDGVLGGGDSNFKTTEKTLPYQFAAKQIDVGDVDDAKDYLVQVLRDAKTPEEQKTTLEGIHASMRIQSPLGRVADRDRDKFLEKFPLEERVKAKRLQAEWLADYETAVTQAKNELNVTVSGGRDRRPSRPSRR